MVFFIGTLSSWGAAPTQSSAKKAGKAKTHCVKAENSYGSTYFCPKSGVKKDNNFWKYVGQLKQTTKKGGTASQNDGSTEVPPGVDDPDLDGCDEDWYDACTEDGCGDDQTTPECDDDCWDEACDR